MSAFICEIELFHNLLSAWRKSYPAKRMSDIERDQRTQAIGQMLIDANFASVNSHYSENDQPETYVYDKRYDRAEISPMQILKSIHCLDYQSCEDDGWEKSDAKRFLFELSWEQHSELTGWEAQQWGGVKWKR